MRRAPYEPDVGRSRARSGFSKQRPIEVTQYCSCSALDNAFEHMNDLIRGDRIHNLLSCRRKTRHCFAVPILGVAIGASLPFCRPDDLPFAILRIVDQGRFQLATVIDKHRIGIGHLQHCGIPCPECKGQIIGIIPNAEIAESVGDIVHAGISSRPNGHQVSRLFQPPSHCLGSRPTTAKVAEAFLRARAPVIDTIRAVHYYRRRGHAIVKRCGIYERLYRGTRLPLSLRSTIETGNSAIKTALNRQYATVKRVLYDHAAAHFRHSSYRVILATIRRYRNDIAGFHRGRATVQDANSAISKANPAIP